MEEINTKIKNKKTIMIVGLSLLLLIVLIVSIGLTSAYFLVDVKNDITESTKIEATLNKGEAKAILTPGVENLRLKLKASDMTKINAIHEVEFYADETKDYVTEQKEGMKKLATLSIQDSGESEVYNCSSNIVISANEGNSVVNKLEAGDMELYLRGGDSIIKEDLVKLKDNNNLTYPVTFTIEGNNSDDLIGYVKLNNSPDKDQSYLEEKSVNIKVEVKDLSCNLVVENETIKTLRSKDTNKTLSSHLTGGMYRYQGSNTLVTNNYVCLGSDCSKDTDKMYRIIGITPEGEMKLIKKEALESSYQWWSDYNEDISWPKSKIYEAISDTAFLNNTNYIPAEWQSKIKDTNWIYGDMLSNSSNGAKQIGPELYKTEIGLKVTSWHAKSTKEAGGIKYPTTGGSAHEVGTEFYYKEENKYWTDYINSKVGLMNNSDYYLATSDTTNCQYNEGVDKYTVCKEQGWLHLSKNDSSPKNGLEWTYIRYGWYIGNGYFSAHDVHSLGYSNSYDLAGNLSVRPVFYLANDITLTGEGTIGDPFIIN